LGGFKQLANAIDGRSSS